MEELAETNGVEEQTEVTEAEATEVVDEATKEAASKVEKDFSTKLKEKISTKEKEVAADLPKPEVIKDAYAPNLKYKAYDIEYDMPDWAKKYITDKETEENFRKTFEKAGGFDPLKKKYEDYKASVEPERSKWHQTYESLAEMQYLLDNKDLHTFFEKAQIPVDDVFNFVRTHIDYQKWDANQKRMYDQNRQSLVSNYEAQKNADYLKQQNETLLRNQHEIQYQQVLSLPEIGAFARTFDEKLGQGMFRKHADEHGAMMFYQTQRNITPLEAVQAVITKYQNMFGTPGSNVQTKDLASLKAQREESKPKGIIPNVGKGEAAQSPAKKRFKSIDEMRKFYKKNYEDVLEA